MDTQPRHDGLSAQETAALADLDALRLQRERRWHVSRLLDAVMSDLDIEHQEKLMFLRADKELETANRKLDEWQSRNGLPLDQASKILTRHMEQGIKSAIDQAILARLDLDAMPVARLDLDEIRSTAIRVIDQRIESTRQLRIDLQKAWQEIQQSSDPR